jgi:hypothetical protein
MGISPDFGSVTHQFQMELGFIVSSFKLSNLPEQGGKKKKKKKKKKRSSN